MKYIIIGVVLLCALAWGGIANRHSIVIQLMSSGQPPPLNAATDEGADTVWFNDYFTVQALDERTFAIGEPRYAQQNYSYLIVGSERAVLFDAGPGFRNIREVAESLTDLPITFVPSHFHYDHTGNEITFDQVAVVDLPYIRARAVDNQLTLSGPEHLGVAEGVAAPTLSINEWLAPGAMMFLGDRQLQVLYTPGHTDDSISLLDLTSGFLFSGDFIYPGPLYAFLSNSNMGDYLAGAETVISQQSLVTEIYGAHRVRPPGAPKLGIGDVKDLRKTLLNIRAGEANASGVYPREYTVNERIILLAEPEFLQTWQSTNRERNEHSN